MRSAPDEPVFFTDRSLGKRFGQALREQGWLVQIHDDHFAQNTSDVELMSEVALRGWVFLTKDKRIRGRSAERAALIASGLRYFALTCGDATTTEMVEVFQAAREQILEIVATNTAPFIAIVAIKPLGEVTLLHRPNTTDDGE